MDYQSQIQGDYDDDFYLTYLLVLPPFAIIKYIQHSKKAPNYNNNYIQMNFKQKREVIANIKRQQQRDFIIKKCRIRNQSYNCEMVQKDIKSQELLQHFKQLKEKNEQNNTQVQKRKSLIKKTIAILPQWIANLQQNNNPQKTVENAFILQNFVKLALQCLNSKLYVQQITNCLVELTGLPKSCLHMLFIEQKAVLKNLIPQCQAILKQTSNMHIILNLLYIFGNTIEYSIQFSQKFDNFQILVLQTISKICQDYPNYDRCISLFLWFIKNSLVVIKNNKFRQNKLNGNKNAQQQANINREQNIKFKKFQIYCLNELQKILFVLCSKFSDSQQLAMQTLSNIQYYREQMAQIFNLMHFMLSDQQLFKPQYKTKDHIASEEIIRIIEIIGQNVSIYIKTFINELNDKSNKKVIHNLFLMLNQLTFNLVNLKILHEIPKIIPELCLMASSSEIKQAQALKTCKIIIEVAPQFSIKHLCQKIVINILLNAKPIFSSQESLVNRNYRISSLVLIQNLQMSYSAHEMRSLIKKVVTCSNKPKEEYQKQCQQYFIYDFVLPLLNATHLILLDEQTENRLMGLQIIYRLVTNWQLNYRMIRRILSQMQINVLIQDMCDQKQSQIYDMALNIMQQLKFDQPDQIQYY